MELVAGGCVVRFSDSLALGTTLNKEALEKYDRKSWEIYTVKVAIGGRKKLQSGGGKKSSASAVTTE